MREPPYALGHLLAFGLVVLCYASALRAAEPADVIAKQKPESFPTGQAAIPVDGEAVAAEPPAEATSVSADDALRSLARSLATLPNLGSVTGRVLMAEAQRGDYLPAISWALAHGYWGLAQLLIENNPKATPDWAKLSLALHRHDRSEMARLLRHPERLPARDRLQAQMYLGQYGRGREDALVAMEVDPHDWRLRLEYLQAVRESASYVDLSGRQESFSGLTQYGPSLHGRLALGDAWGILLDADALRQSASSSAQLLNVPAWSHRETIGLYWVNPRWELQGEIGNYQGLRDVVTFNLKESYRLSARSTLSAVWDYHDRSLQSPVMAVAGMSSRLELQLTQQLGSWLIGMGAGWQRYQGQDGIDLGDDVYGEGSLMWRHDLGPWQLQLGPFADYHRLHRRDAVRGIVANTIAPATRTIGAVLPGSYGDVGLRLQWGQWERALDSDWTPYLAVSLYENTRFGFQYQFDTGLSTTVFGPDRLRVGFSQGQGGNGLAINQQIFKMGYRYYF
jgi:hypothetical protein